MWLCYIGLAQGPLNGAVLRMRRRFCVWLKERKKTPQKQQRTKAQQVEMFFSPPVCWFFIFQSVKNYCKSVDRTALYYRVSSRRYIVLPSADIWHRTTIAADPQIVLWAWPMSHAVPWCSFPKAFFLDRLRAAASCGQQLVMFDAQDAKFRSIKLRPKQAGCAVCGETPSVTQLVDYEAFCGAAATDKVVHNGQISWVALVL